MALEVVVLVLIFCIVLPSEVAEFTPVQGKVLLIVSPADDGMRLRK